METSSKPAGSVRRPDVAPPLLVEEVACKLEGPERRAHQEAERRPHNGLFGGKEQEGKHRVAPASRLRGQERNGREGERDRHRPAQKAGEVGT